MNGTAGPPTLLVIQLTGGNDFLNTVIPQANSLYYDYRPSLSVDQDRVLPLNNEIALHPGADAFKKLYDQGKLAIILGVGYPNPSRSHFLSMLKWHTCEPSKPTKEGWLGRVIREFDPNHENVLTGVNFGAGLPQAVVSRGVPVTSLANLDNYGLMHGISDQEKALQQFKQMYGPTMGAGPVMEYLAETGLGLVAGAEELKLKVPDSYESDVDYGSSEIANVLRDVARIHLAKVGTRVFYVNQSGYDTHAGQMSAHGLLLRDLSQAVTNFYEDLEKQNEADNVLTLVFSEFGRRVKDNGSGTDHGAAGVAFLIGNSVLGGLYGEYPSLEQSALLNGEDLDHTYDFRGLYATVLEQEMGLDANNIVGGAFEQIPVIRRQ